MPVEDLLYPMLGFYWLTPNWVKRLLGGAYASFPVSLRTGRRYREFHYDAGMRERRELEQLCSRKLAATLGCALQSVPAYRRHRYLADKLDRPFDVLRELPLVSKDDIKHDPARFLADGVSPRARLKTATGGSTSTPMRFFLHKGVTRTREYAFMADFQRRVGLGPRDVILAMRGRTVESAAKRGGALWMYEPIKRQLILSSDFLERMYMPEYLKAIRAWKPSFIQAYPSTIYPLARWLKENPAPDVTQRIRGIMLYSENVMDYHMALLREVFSCPVLKHYGQSERVLMGASMPDDDRIFFWPQYGHMELVDEAGHPVTRPGVLGEIVGTGYDNHVMPFVRYRTGDMGILSEGEHPLLPGFPVLQSIEGRRQEFLVCRDHRLIAVCGMGAAHSDAMAVVESMQLEQSEPGHFVIKVVSPQPLPAASREKIVRSMEAKTQGGCTAELREVSAIPRTLRGKHQLLIQRLDISRYLGAPVQQ